MRLMRLLVMGTFIPWPVQSTVVVCVFINFIALSYKYVVIVIIITKVLKLSTYFNVKFENMLIRYKYSLRVVIKI